VQLRCLNFMAYTLEGRVAVTLLKLTEKFAIFDGQRVRLTVPARHLDVVELVGATTPGGSEELRLR
jgi:hypothetical protein